MALFSLYQEFQRGYEDNLRRNVKEPRLHSHHGESLVHHLIAHAPLPAFINQQEFLHNLRETEEAGLPLNQEKPLW